MEVKHHPGKTNVVANDLNGKSIGLMAPLLTQKKRSLRELEALQIVILLPKDRNYMAALQVTSPLVQRIKLQQKEDPELMKIKKGVEERRNKDFAFCKDTLWYKSIVCSKCT